MFFKSCCWCKLRLLVFSHHSHGKYAIQVVVGDFFHEQYQKQQTKPMLLNIRGGGRLFETSAQNRQSEIREMPMPPRYAQPKTGNKAGYESVLFLAGGGWALGRLGISWHKAWSCWTWIWPRYNIEKTYPIWTIQIFFKNPYMHFFHCHNPISRNISKIHLGKKNMLATLAVFGHQLISGSFPVYHLPPGQLSMKNYRGSFQGGEMVTEMFAFLGLGNSLLSYSTTK